MAEIEMNHYFINENCWFREINVSSQYLCLKRSIIQLFEYRNLEFTTVLLTEKSPWGEFSIFVTAETYFKDSVLRRTTIWK